MAKVLVVDDDAEIRSMVSVVLEAAGHEVAIAEDGDAAIKKIKRVRYDLVLLDIMMPEVDGYGVLDEVRAMPSREDLPIVVLTARHDPDGLAREVASGATDHLAKPFLLSELEDVIERALSAPATAQGERQRMLQSDAEVYGSLGSLISEARAASV